MLFDLRGTGRRRTVKIVYISLAFLMGGGLVLFGIGGATSGGLIDAITQRGGSSGDGSDRFRKLEADAAAKTRANPKAAPAWAALARARFQLAGQGENFDVAKSDFTANGRARLTGAEQAWDRYLALNPPKPDDRVAGLMVQAFTALGKPNKAAQAQEVITTARPTAATFTQLAVYAYSAGQSRKGDLAAKKAIELTDPDMRQALKGQLDQAKAQAATSAVGGAAAGGTPSPTP